MDQSVILSLFSVTWAVIGFFFVRLTKRESSDIKLIQRFNDLSRTIYGDAETKRESLIENVQRLTERVNEIGQDVKFLRGQSEQ